MNNYAQVNVVFSSNGGASWSLAPQNGTLNGDYGSVSSGTRSIIWNAAAQLPADTYNNNFRARLTATAGQATATKISAPFPVDLSSLLGGLAVSGRVKDANTGVALSGASVTLARQSAVTTADGGYAFANVALSSGNTLTVSKSGYVSHTETISIPAGAATVTVQDIGLSTGSAPIISRVAAKYDGIFLGGVPVCNTYTAYVNWNGAIPGEVHFFANGQLVGDVTGEKTSYVCEVDMAEKFQPALRVDANTLEVFAISSEGVPSLPVTRNVVVVPLPNATMQLLPNFSVYAEDSEVHAAVDWSFPEPPIKSTIDLPVVGKFGLEIAANTSFDYTVTDGGWEAALGVGAEGKQGKRGRRPKVEGLIRYPKMKLYIGNKEISGNFRGGACGTATVAQGITFDEVFGSGSINAKLELGRVGLPDLFGPGLSTFLGKFPMVSDVVKTVTVLIYVTPGIAGEVIYELQPQFAFKSAELTGKIGVEASYEPDLEVAKMRLYLGGEPSATFQLPPPLLKQMRFKAYAGVEFEIWLLKLGPYENVFVDKAIPEGESVATVLLSADGSAIFRCISGVNASAWHQLRRDYLAEGPEFFVAKGDSGRETVSAFAGAGALDAFRKIGSVPLRGAVGRGVSQVAAIDGIVPLNVQPPAAAPLQADMTLLANVFPNGEPALAGRSEELMLLYVGDNGVTNTLQCTDIRWMRWNGTAWSVPASILADTRAEFAPQVAYDGNGDAIAMWERVADTNFDQVDLTAMAARMEIAWARWDHATGTWTVPQNLTINAVLDHAPLLCGPLDDGSVQAVWTRNNANLLMGTNGAPDQVLQSRWNPVAGSWSAEQTLLAAVTNRLSQSLVCSTNYAAYGWCADADGVLTNDTDQKAFLCEWKSGAWGAAQRWTTNSVADKTIRLAVVRGTGIAQDGFETGNFTRLPWTFSGNANWVVQTNTVQTGIYAAASDVIGHSQSSVLRLNAICGVGSVTFNYKVSSERNYDFLRFYVDGIQKGSWSGGVEWSLASYPVTEGSHTFEWIYSKDGSVSSGNDKAWVDDVALPGEESDVPLAVWQQETNLVMRRGFQGVTRTIRANSGTAGFADFALTQGPAGNLVLLWQEMTESGSDAHYMVYDPVSDLWSRDAVLCSDAPLERSFSPIWDNVGNLTVAYNKVEIDKVTKTVELEVGGTVAIDNVPQPGQVDLCVTKRALVRDLAINMGDFTADGVNFLPGDAVMLNALVRNLGDVAMSNTVVGFYDGDPDAGGVLVSNVVMAGWFGGAATNAVQALWVVPEPATKHTLFVVVNRAGLASEFNPINNAQSLFVSGTDLETSLMTYDAETNGTVRVYARVRNVGAPAATNSVLSIRRCNALGMPLTETALATMEIPVLEPGRLAQVALDLPAGTQPEEDAFYQLQVSGNGVSADIDISNNVTVFSVHLWLDTDGDGIPDHWEIAHGLNARDAADAAEDTDGDGLNALQEYRNGTNPLLRDTDGDGADDCQEIAAGTDPNSATDVFKIVAADGSESYSMSVTWNAKSGSVYRVEAAPVVTGPWDTAPDNAGTYGASLQTAVSNGVLRYCDSQTGLTNRFYRVRLVVP